MIEITIDEQACVRRGLADDAHGFDEVRVALGLDQSAGRQPCEALAKLERRAHDGSERRVGLVLLRVQSIGNQDQVAPRDRVPADGLLDRYGAHGGGDIRQRIREPVGEIPPSSPLVLIVQGRDDAWSRSHEPA